MESCTVHIVSQRPKFGWCLVWMVVTAFLDCESWRNMGKIRTCRGIGVLDREVEAIKSRIVMVLIWKGRHVPLSHQNKSHPSTISFQPTKKNRFRGFGGSLILRPTDVICWFQTLENSMPCWFEFHISIIFQKVYQPEVKTSGWNVVAKLCVRSW